MAAGGRSTHSISLRSRPVGGAIRTRARLSSSDLFVSSRRLVLLVHGFNVSEEAAHDSYGKFERHLGCALLPTVVRVYWPGDAKWLSRLSYPRQLPRARESAQRVVERLTADLGRRAAASAPFQPAALEISIVAHSLGCRLTLEFLERMWSASSTSVRIPLVVLMAAAVPRYDVARGGAYNIMMSGLPRIWVLQSTSDSTLRRWFRPGQFLQRPWGSIFGLGDRGALGRRGARPHPNVSVVAGDWDHSDYWPDKDIATAIDDELGGRAGSVGALHQLRQRIQRKSLQPRRLAGRHLGG